MRTWIAEVDGDFDDVFALRPDLHEAYTDFAGVFWTHELLDPVVLELCRLRVAQLLQCDAALESRTPQAVAAGLTETDVGALANWPADARFSDAQRAALAVAEQFVLDPHGVTEEQRGAVVTHFGDAGLVALVEALAIYDGFARFRTILDITRG